MMNFRKKSHSVPELNTSSLPDLIFSVLFFFMIVTHMRQVTLKVECRMPEGKNLTRLTKKSYFGILLRPQLNYCLRFITFNLVNSSLSFSSSALLML